MREDLVCYKCGKKIERKDDLIVATYLLKIVTYHNKCYAEHLKKSNSLLLGEPLNTTMYTLRAILVSIISIIYFFIGKREGSRLYFILVFIPLIPISYRLLSLYLYERRYDEK